MHTLAMSEKVRFKELNVNLQIKMLATLDNSPYISTQLFCIFKCTIQGPISI